MTIFTNIGFSLLLKACSLNFLSPGNFNYVKFQNQIPNLFVLEFGTCYLGFKALTIRKIVIFAIIRDKCIFGKFLFFVQFFLFITFYVKGITK
jgi:hypothetical protein